MHNSNSPNLRVKRRRGVTAAEFVVLLPLLVLLCLTSVDFGRFAYGYIALGNSARVGAEVGATRSYSAATATTWQQLVESAMREEFGFVGGLDASQLVIDVDVTMDNSDLPRVTVNATYPFTTVTSWPGIPRPLNMHRSVVMRRFR